MSHIIEVCHYCVAPKRHPGCHDKCPEYLKEKAKYEERKAIEDKKRFTGVGIQQQKNRSIRKAMRTRKAKCKW